MRILLTGATGNAGSGALKAAIADPEVRSVLVLARREPPFSDPKVRFVRHQDFTDYAGVDLSGLDAALWCLGTSQMRVSRAELHRVTVDFAVAGAKAFQAANQRGRFVHLSGAGADPSMRSRVAFAAEKGEAENALDALGLAGLWHCRPGYIHPALKLPRRLLAERAMAPLAPLLRPFHGAMIDAQDLGRAMLAVARGGHAKHVLENRELRALAARRVSA